MRLTTARRQLGYTWTAARPCSTRFQQTLDHQPHGASPRVDLRVSSSNRTVLGQVRRVDQMTVALHWQTCLPADRYSVSVGFAISRRPIWAQGVQSLRGRRAVSPWTPVRTVCLSRSKPLPLDSRRCGSDVALDGESLARKDLIAVKCYPLWLSWQRGSVGTRNSVAQSADLPKNSGSAEKCVLSGKGS